jgi:acetyl esterase/lipase
MVLAMVAGRPGGVVRFASFTVVTALLAGLGPLLQGCGSGGSDIHSPTTTPPPTPGPYVPPPGPERGAQCFVGATWELQDVQVTSSVSFGRAFNPYTGHNETLQLDIYAPPGNDPRKKRPAIVLVHGGAFVEGDDKSDYMPAFAKQFAIRGYVAFSINYRMGVSVSDLLRHPADLAPVKMAQEDAKAAVRYVRASAASLHIDPARILMGGHSAGAITSLYHAYMPNASEGNSGTPGVYSGVQGVVSMSGEMKYQAFCRSIDKTSYKPSGCLLDASPPIDLTSKMQAGSAPLLLVHGTMDQVVPYLNGKAVNARAEALGLDHKFIVIPGADHMGAPAQLLDDAALLTEMFNYTSKVLHLAGSDCPRNAKAETVDTVAV